MTAHQIGTVLDSASGITGAYLVNRCTNDIEGVAGYLHLPRRVESTIMQLYQRIRVSHSLSPKQNDQQGWQEKMDDRITDPPCSLAIGRSCKFSLRKLKSHWPV